MSEIFDLTPEQQKAFDALKRAANKCNKLKIGFVNMYGSIHPYDKAIISHMGFEKTNAPAMDYGYPSNTIDNLGGDSFADDQNMHFYVLTKKGEKIISK